MKGAWTGGHQENVNLRAVNYNHGPSDSLWLTVDNMYVEQFRNIVEEQFNINISEKEGLWYCDWEYVMMNQIPIKVFR